MCLIQIQVIRVLKNTKRLVTQTDIIIWAIWSLGWILWPVVEKRQMGEIKLLFCVFV